MKRFINDITTAILVLLVWVVGCLLITPILIVVFYLLPTWFFSLEGTPKNLAFIVILLMASYAGVVFNRIENGE